MFFMVGFSEDACDTRGVRTHCSQQCSDDGRENLQDSFHCFLIHDRPGLSVNNETTKDFVICYQHHSYY